MNTRISNDLIRQHSHVIGTDPCAVTRLDLSSLGIESVEGLEECTSLIELSLSRNQLGSGQLNFANEFGKLQILDLSCNKLQHIPPNMPDHLKELRTLSLKQNKLSDVSEMIVLQRFSKLRSLSFQSNDGSLSNPLCSSPIYLNKIDEFLPNLDFHDEESTVLRKGSCIAPLARSVEANPEFKNSLPIKPWNTDEIEKTNTLLNKYDDHQYVAECEKSFNVAQIEFKNILGRAQEELCQIQMKLN